MSSNRPGRATAAPAQLFYRNRSSYRIDTGTTIFLRDVKAEQTQGTHLAYSRPIEFSGLVHLVCLRLNFTRHKIMHRFAPHALFVGKVVIHGWHLLFRWLRSDLM